MTTSMRDAAEIIAQAYDAWYELNEEWPYNNDLVRPSLPTFVLDALLDGANRVALVRTPDGVKIVRQVRHLSLDSVGNGPFTMWRDVDGAR